MAEIYNSQEVLSEGNGRKVVGIGPHFVAKYGLTVAATEGDVLVWLEQSTAIRAPKLYAVFKRINRNTLEELVCLIMERIHGDSLKELWPNADLRQKIWIIQTLKCFFTRLRALPPPESSTPYCNPMGGPLLDEMFLSREAAYGGPFRTENNLISALTNRARGRTDMSRDYLNELEQRLHEFVRPTAVPVFTHGHVNLDHIYIVPEYVNGVVKNKEIVLVDWEFAGWYA
jgi:hypothetical protein